MEEITPLHECIEKVVDELVDKIINNEDEYFPSEETLWMWKNKKVSEVILKHPEALEEQFDVRVRFHKNKVFILRKTPEECKTCSCAKCTVGEKFCSFYGTNRTNYCKTMCNKKNPVGYCNVNEKTSAVVLKS